MKKLYTAMLLVLLAAMFSVGVYSLADYDAAGSVSEKREFVKPEIAAGRDVYPRAGAVLFRYVPGPRIAFEGKPDAQSLLLLFRQR